MTVTVQFDRSCLTMPAGTQPIGQGLEVLEAIDGLTRTYGYSLMNIAGARYSEASLRVLPDPQPHVSDLLIEMIGCGHFEVLLNDPAHGVFSGGYVLDLHPIRVSCEVVNGHHVILAGTGADCVSHVFTPDFGYAPHLYRRPNHSAQIRRAPLRVGPGLV